MNQPDKTNPSKDEWRELLEALIEEAAEGRLATVTFMLRDPRMPDCGMIDSWGSPELAEIACRKTVEDIALAQEVAAQPQPALAKAIRDGMIAEKVRH